MFQVRGQFELKIDAKGRVALPVRLRERFVDSKEAGLVLTHHDGGIQGYTASRWRTMERRFADVSPFNPGARAFLLAFVAGAVEVEPDAAGRISLPNSLRRLVGLEKDCLLLSYLGVIELWNPDRHATRAAAAALTVQSDPGAAAGISIYDADDRGSDL